jgi:DMSO/TMAO reductase YedYZ molybdopterin-dependent catalytic subunit
MSRVNDMNDSSHMSTPALAADPGPATPRGRATRIRLIVAGIITAAVALTTTEFIGSFAGKGHSTIITAVGTKFIDRFAANLKTLAVKIFGTHDKPALIIGIITVTVLLGIAAAFIEARRAWLGSLLIAGFGVVGLLAAFSSPLAPRALSIFAVAVAVLLGVGALRFLVARTMRAAGTQTRQPEPPPNAVAVPMPVDLASKFAARRQFLGAAVTLGSGAAAAAALAKIVRNSVGAPAGSETVTLGAPVSEGPAGSATTTTVGGLPVRGISRFVTPNKEFYRIDTALIVPRPNVNKWTLTIDGMVDKPLKLTYADLQAMDLEDHMVTIACVSNEVGGDLIGNAVWRGVPLPTLLELAGAQQGATQIMGHSIDGFTAGFPTELATDGRTALVAIGMNGEPLPADHGFPARLIIAGIYGYVSAVKWLERIELTTWEAADGYWIPRGWSKEGPIKTQSRIDAPLSSEIKPGPTAIGGVAWAQGRGIKVVEVSIDKGPWQQAELGETTTDESWVQWMLRWDATSGRHELRVRATDGTGAVQVAERAPVAPDGATGYHTRSIEVT